MRQFCPHHAPADVLFDGTDCPFCAAIAELVASVSTRMSLETQVRDLTAERDEQARVLDAAWIASKALVAVLDMADRANPAEPPRGRAFFDGALAGQAGEIKVTTEYAPEPPAEAAVANESEPPPGTPTREAIKADLRAAHNAAHVRGAGERADELWRFEFGGVALESSKARIKTLLDLLAQLRALPAVAHAQPEPPAEPEAPAVEELCRFSGLPERLFARDDEDESAPGMQTEAAPEAEAPATRHPAVYAEPEPTAATGFLAGATEANPASDEPADEPEPTEAQVWQRDRIAELRQAFETWGELAKIYADLTGGMPHLTVGAVELRQGIAAKEWERRRIAEEDILL